MRRALTAAAVVSLTAILGACGSIASTGTSQPASAASSASDQEVGATVLQKFDATNGHGGQAVAAYRAELDTLVGKCTNPTKDVTRFVENTYNLEVQNGITDETAFTLLQHLDQSVPDGTKMGCQGVLGAYLTLREG